MKQAWIIILALNNSGQHSLNSIKESTHTCLKEFIKHKLATTRFTDELSLISWLNTIEEPNIMQKFAKVSVEMYNSVQILLQENLKLLEPQTKNQSSSFSEVLHESCQLLDARVKKLKFERHILILSNSSEDLLSKDVQAYLRLNTFSSANFLYYEDHISKNMLELLQEMNFSVMNISQYSNMLKNSPKGSVKNVVNKYQGGVFNISEKIFYPVQIFTSCDRSKPPTLSKISLPATKKLLQENNITLEESQESDIYSIVSKASKIVQALHHPKFGKVARETLYYYEDSEEEEEQSEDNEATEPEKHYVEKADQINGYTFGDEDIPIESAVMASLSFSPKCEFRLLFFMQRENLKTNLVLSPMDIVCYRDNYEVEGACNAEAFTQLVYTMLKLKKVGICKLTSRVKALYTRLVQIIPVLQIMHPTTKQVREVHLATDIDSIKNDETMIGMFYLCRLPTRHDLREYHMNKIGQDESSIVTKGDVHKVKEYAQANLLSDDDYCPKMHSNPRLEHFFQKCLNEALGEDS